MRIVEHGIGVCQTASQRLRSKLDEYLKDVRAYVKSPVASLCFVCSSVRNRVSVTMSVLIFSCATGTVSPLVVMVAVGLLDGRMGRVVLCDADGEVLAG